MNINFDAQPIRRQSRRARAWAIVAGIFLVLYTAVFWFQPSTLLSIPLAEYWDDKIGDVIVLLASISAVRFSLKMARNFERNERPRQIWSFFTAGLGFWLGGEALGFLFDYLYWYRTFPEYTVPEFTLMDVCWILGYIFFGLSLYQQFQSIYSSRDKSHRIYLYSLYVLLIFLVAFGLTNIAHNTGLGGDISRGGIYLAILYPVFDLFQGVAALWFFFLFGRGWLGRPWWGLLAFALADAIGTFDWMGGFRNISDAAYAYWYTLSAVSYLAGYVIIALAFMAADDHLYLTPPHEQPASS